MHESITFNVGNCDKNKRLDVVLANKIQELSRSQIKKIINGNYVRVNNQVVKASYRVESGDRVEINLPSFNQIEVLPENIPLEIIYEDSISLLSIRKRGWWYILLLEIIQELW